MFRSGAFSGAVTSLGDECLDEARTLGGILEGSGNSEGSLLKEMWPCLSSFRFLPGHFHLPFLLGGLPQPEKLCASIAFCHKAWLYLRLMLKTVNTYNF